MVRHSTPDKSSYGGSVSVWAVRHCTAMFMSGAMIIMETITTSSRPKRIQRDQRPALPVFCGVGRGTTTRVSLVPLSARRTSRVFFGTATVFGWFVSWISSVVRQRPHTLQELRRGCGSWSEGDPATGPPGKEIGGWMTTELIQPTNQPKPEEVATVTSVDPKAVSGTRETRGAGPPPTPHTTERTSRWARWILFGRLFVVILSVIIVAPFINIAVHIKQAKVI